MDRIFFLNGLLFFLLAWVCLKLARIEATKLAWPWLVCFSVAGGTEAWLEAAGLLLPDAAWLPVA